MNAIVTTNATTLNPAMYNLGEATACVSMALDVLKKEVADPLARFMSLARQSFEAGRRATQATALGHDGAGTGSTPSGVLPPARQPSIAAQAIPTAAKLTAVPSAAPTSATARRQDHRRAVLNKRRRAHRLRRQRLARRHRTRRPPAVTAAVIEQLFHVSRRTLRLRVADGSLRDLREPGHAQNAQLLLDLRQVARRWTRRVGVKVAVEHWVLQLIDEEIFFAQRPELSRQSPEVRT